MGEKPKFTSQHQLIQKHLKLITWVLFSTDEHNQIRYFGAIWFCNVFPLIFIFCKIQFVSALHFVVEMRGEVVRDR